MLLWVNGNSGILFLTGLIEDIYKEVIRLYSSIATSISMGSIVDNANN